MVAWAHDQGQGGVFFRRSIWEGAAKGKSGKGVPGGPKYPPDRHVRTPSADLDWKIPRKIACHTLLGIICAYLQWLRWLHLGVSYSVCAYDGYDTTYSRRPSTQGCIFAVCGRNFPATTTGGQMFRCGESIFGFDLERRAARSIRSGLRGKSANKRTHHGYQTQGYPRPWTAPTTQPLHSSSCIRSTPDVGCLHTTSTST